LSSLGTEGRRVLSREPVNAEAADEAFSSLITPAGQRFVRCHFPVPSLAPDPILRIDGAVTEQRQLSLRELRALPAVVQTVLTECAGNGRALLDPPVSGEQWSSRAVSTAQWTGVPLCNLVELRDTAVELVFTGADGGGFRRSLPRDVALDPSTLVAWEMNGAPIPPQFGGPVRLIVPGWYGMASVKWLTRIEAVETPFEGEFQSRRYVYGPGAPVTRMRVKSMFVGLLRHVRAGTPLRIGGLAWGGEGVRSVAVEIDGAPWPARLVGPALPHAWRRFELEWQPARPGRYSLVCRATDAGGASQPDEAEWNPLGYGNNAAQRAEVVAD